MNKAKANKLQWETLNITLDLYNGCPISELTAKYNEPGAELLRRIYFYLQDNEMLNYLCPNRLFQEYWEIFCQQEQLDCSKPLFRNSEECYLNQRINTLEFKRFHMQYQDEKYGGYIEESGKQKLFQDVLTYLIIPMVEYWMTEQHLKNTAA